MEEIFIKDNWAKINVSPLDLKSQCIKLPSTPGLYMIETTTPIDIFTKLGKPNVNGRVNIRSRVLLSSTIKGNLLIKVKKKQFYCVYIGHQQNLRQRFKEHFYGSKGTGCLAIFRYKKLREFKWRFYYFELSSINSDFMDSPLLRTILECKLRSHFGWPILCAK